MDYSNYKIVDSSLPDSIFYIANFIDANEEKQLINQVLRAPKPKWQYLSNRSLQVYGGYPNEKLMLSEDLPEWLQNYTNKLYDINIFDGHRPNQVLINRYEPGQGIFAHEDGPLYYPCVATINTGSHTVLNFYEKLSMTSADDNQIRKYRFSLLLWPRSLSIIKQNVYKNYLHEIEELHVDKLCDSDKNIINLNLIGDNIDKYLDSNNCIKRHTRYSFTIRFIPEKCHKLNVTKILFKKNS